MNTFLNNLREQNNYTETENGGTAHKSTLNKVYDMFAFAAAYRGRTDDDCILLFKNAFEANEMLALRCLFYMRDIRGGQGERRFFRVCYHWLAKNYSDIALKFMKLIPTYGRYDDLYCLVGTPIEKNMFDFLKEIISADIESCAWDSHAGVSLCAKWLKSENASSKETNLLGNKTRKAFGMSHKEYRKILSRLRTRINIVEKLMSENRWNEIEFDKIPSKAGMKYRNAFAHNDIIGEKYSQFIADKNSKVHASALYPYEIVHKATNYIDWGDRISITETEREVLNKYWENLPDYLDGKKCKMMTVIDTSGSMTSGNGSYTPIDVAISLGLYCAERIGEPFNNCFISFASRPQFIETEGVDFVDKVHRIYRQNLCDNTNLVAVFDLLKNTILTEGVKYNDIPNTIVVISDMEIDSMSNWRNKNTAATEMERIRQEWAREGLDLPRLVYWNVDARHNIILDETNNDNITYVSGCSPIIFKSVLTGKSGIELMLDILNSNRYIEIE